MTVTSEVSSIFYYGNTNDPQTFAVPFYFLANSNLVVSKSDGITKVDLFETTDYTVSGADNLNGGSITMVYTDSTNDHRIGASEKITIERTLPVTQEVDFITGGQFRAETQEQGLDRIVMILQQILRGGINLSSMPHNLLADLGIHEAGHTWKISDINSVSRNLYDKFMEMRRISVMDFGAVGDGVTDDTIAIQLTIDFVAALGGGTILFPAGVYIITSTIEINKSYIKLVGVVGGGNSDGYYKYPIIPKPDATGFQPQFSPSRIVWHGNAGGTMIRFASSIINNPSGSPSSYYREKTLTCVGMGDIELHGWDFTLETGWVNYNDNLPLTQPIAGICLEVIGVISSNFKRLTAAYASDFCYKFMAAPPRWVDDGLGGWTWDRINSARSFSHSIIEKVYAFNMGAQIEPTDKASHVLGGGVLFSCEVPFNNSDCHNLDILEMKVLSRYYPAVEVRSADLCTFDRLQTSTWQAYGLVLHGTPDSAGIAAGFDYFGTANLSFNDYGGGVILVCGTDTDNITIPGTSYATASRGSNFTGLDVNNGSRSPIIGKDAICSFRIGTGKSAGSSGDAKGLAEYNTVLGNQLHASIAGVGGTEQIVAYYNSDLAKSITATPRYLGDWNTPTTLNDIQITANNGIFLSELGLTENKIISFAGCSDPANDGDYNVSLANQGNSSLYALLDGTMSQVEVISDITVHPQFDWSGWNHGLFELYPVGIMNPLKFIDGKNNTSQAGTLIIKQNAAGDGVWPGWDTATAAKMIWLNGVEPQGLATMPANNGVIISISYSENIGKYLCQYSTIIDMS